MAYYSALIAQWQTLSGATDVKLAQINSLKVPTGKPIAATVGVNDVVNCIDPVDLDLLDTPQLLRLQIILSGAGSVNVSPGTTVRKFFMNAFGGKGSTIANLDAALEKFDTPTDFWWAVNGYPRTFDAGDIKAAGLS